MFGVQRSAFSIRCSVFSVSTPNSLIRQRRSKDLPWRAYQPLSPRTVIAFPTPWADHCSDRP